MLKLSLPLTSILIVGLVVLAGPPTSAEANATQTMLVRFRTPGVLSTAGTNVEPLAQLGIVRLAVPAGMSSTEFVHLAGTNPAVAWVEPEGIVRLETTPNDPRLADQTAVTQTALSKAWDETQGSAQTTIAIVDSGVDGQHEDLAGRVVEGYNFLTETAVPAGSNSDDNGHGTAVAGVIGAVTNNGKGIAGVNWQARLLPLKVTNPFGEATTTNVANAIVFAADKGARVINLSLGTSSDFQVFHDAISYAASKGVIMVGAAGNDNGAPVLFPAANPQVIAVGSVGSSDGVSNFSNGGPELDLVAPGENILSTALSGSHASYATESGTSFATPYVAGIASLVAARFPSLSPAQIQTILQDQADKPSGMAGQNFTTSYGFGRVNGARSVSIHAAWVSQNSYPTLLAGQSYQFEVKLTNTGSSVWGPQTIRLGTDRLADRIPIFTREDRVGGLPSGWLSPNRVSLIESQVSPGQTGTFRFFYTVPTNVAAGTYREYFRGVAEQITWLEDMGIFWDVTVQTLADTYHAAWVNQNSYPNLQAGQSYQFQVQLRNTGTSPWQQGTVFLATDRDQNRIPPFIREDQVGNLPSGWAMPNRIQLVEASVSPGQLGTFRFFYTVPTSLPPGVYREYFRGIAEHITWLEDLGIFWDITVSAPSQ